MGTRRIKRIFTAQMQEGEARELSYTPARHEAKAVGLLFTSGAALSLCFDNNTELMFDQVLHIHQPRHAPDKRMIRLDKELNGKLLRGMVSYKGTGQPYKTARTVNVYLVIEQMKP